MSPSIEEARQKYAEEREKRLRSDGIRSVLSIGRNVRGI